MRRLKLTSSALPYVFDWLGDSEETAAARRVDKLGVTGLLTGHADAASRPAWISVASRFFAGEEK